MGLFRPPLNAPHCKGHPMKDQLWYVPYSKGIDRLNGDCFRRRKKDAVAAFVKGAFGGNKDWEFCKRQGWRIICVRVTRNFHG